MGGLGTGGVATAVAEALDGAEGQASLPVGDGVQPDLWAEPEGEGAGPLDDSLRSMAEALFGKPRQGRGAGRPKGAQNKQTQEFRRLYLSRHRHPVLVLGDFTSVPVEELAARFRTGDLLAVAKFQAQCAIAAAPYIEKRQPLDVAVKHDQGLTLIIGGLDGGQQAARPAIDAAFVVAGESQQDQWVSGIDPDAVGMAQLAGGPIAQPDQGLGAMGEGIAHLPPDPSDRATPPSGLPDLPDAARDLGAPPPTDFPAV